MIIEITGSPRAGKSTIIEQCCSNLRDRVILFSDDMVLYRYGVLPAKHPYINRFQKDSLVLSTCWPFFKKYLTFITYAANVILASREPPFLKMNTFRNILLKIARFEYIRRNLMNQVVIVDEGLSHIPFNLIDYAQNERLFRADTHLNKTLSKLNGVLKAVAVVVIVRDLSEVTMFLAKAGHRRISDRMPYPVQHFIAFNHLLSEHYVNHGDFYFQSKSIFKLGFSEPAVESEMLACLLSKVAGI